ncbi:hypothetical protein ID866_2014 [Astraeus odoratus]|nr:hypothetical protein ID866_2014 [Astraeus odoratus]
MPPPAGHPSLCLEVLPQTFQVKQYPRDHVDIAKEVLHQVNVAIDKPGLFSLTHTAEEISVVCEATDDGEDRWRCIKIMGPMDFERRSLRIDGCDLQLYYTAEGGEDPGVRYLHLVRSWNTDYILVPVESLDDAVTTLRLDGWQFI